MLKNKLCVHLMVSITKSSLDTFELFLKKKHEIIKLTNRGSINVVFFRKKLKNI